MSDHVELDPYFEDEYEDSEEYFTGVWEEDDCDDAGDCPDDDDCCFDDDDWLDEDDETDDNQEFLNWIPDGIPF